jgi:hypothetical protein
MQRFTSTATPPSVLRTMMTGSVPTRRVTKSPGLGISLSWPTKTHPRRKIRSISSSKMRGSV